VKIEKLRGNKEFNQIIIRIQNVNYKRETNKLMRNFRYVNFGKKNGNKL